jgi:hypothetical protein
MPLIDHLFTTGDQIISQVHVFLASVPPDKAPSALRTPHVAVYHAGNVIRHIAFLYISSNRTIVMSDLNACLNSTVLVGRWFHRFRKPTQALVHRVRRDEFDDAVRDLVRSDFSSLQSLAATFGYCFDPHSTVIQYTILNWRGKTRTSRKRHVPACPSYAVYCFRYANR